MFTNLLLADEINRTPPKTQAALLEAMQERQVTVDGAPQPLPDPFLVLATQNPIEYEGTYPLPEAQLDRFLVKHRRRLSRPRRTRSAMLAPRAPRRRARRRSTTCSRSSAPTTLRAARAAVDATRVTTRSSRYVVALVRRTRELPSVALGASPRAAVHLLARGQGAPPGWRGRDFVTPDDVGRVAPAVLRHRLCCTPEAELERYRPDDAVARRDRRRCRSRDER